MTLVVRLKLVGMGRKIDADVNDSEVNDDDGVVIMLCHIM